MFPITLFCSFLSSGFSISNSLGQDTEIEKGRDKRTVQSSNLMSKKRYEMGKEGSEEEAKKVESSHFHDCLSFSPLQNGLSLPQLVSVFIWQTGSNGWKGALQKERGLFSRHDLQTTSINENCPLSPSPLPGRLSLFSHLLQKEEQRQGKGELLLPRIFLSFPVNHFFPYLGNTLKRGVTFDFSRGKEASLLLAMGH